MPTANIINERKRLSETWRFLAGHAGQGTRDQGLDHIASIAAAACETSMAAITLIDQTHVHFQACYGLSATQLARPHSLFDATLSQDEALVVIDTLSDPRLSRAVMVRDYPFIRSYAGIPLVSSKGFRIGTLSVMDSCVTEMRMQGLETLPSLANLTIEYLQRRRAANDLDQAIADHSAVHIALTKSEQFANSTIDALPQIIAVLDGIGRIISINKSWRDFARDNGGDTDSWGIGANYLDVCRRAGQAGSREAAQTARGIQAIINGEHERFTIEYPCHRPGKKRWFVVRASRFFGQGPARVVISHENITARKTAEIKLKDQAEHDDLTHLTNRARFQKVFEHCFHRCAQEEGRSVFVLFVDLDRFKFVNDSLGHSIGNELLLSVANDIKRAVRSWCAALSGMQACVARLGGDEFGILIDGAADLEQVVSLAEDLLKTIGISRMIHSHEIYTTASIGIAGYQSGDEQAEEVIRRADIAMYQAKIRGKHRVEVFDQQMHEQISKTMRMEVDLRHALERDELFLNYQPVVCLLTGRLTGFEALLRWQRPGFGLVSPAQFIPLAEDTGLIEPIGRWVTRTACRQLAQWQSIWRGDEPLTMNVNLSRRQLQDEGLVGSIRETIELIGVSPRTLRLEVTESAIVELSDAVAKLHAIKDLGVLLYVDDFGTGQSSLTCLHRFPLDGLKIDRSFVQNAAGRRDMAALIHAVVMLGVNLNLGVVAEGLETAEQVAMLQSMDCAFGQGYFFAKPLSIEDAEHLIKQNHQLGLLVSDSSCDSSRERERDVSQVT